MRCLSQAKFDQEVDVGGVGAGDEGVLPHLHFVARLGAALAVENIGFCRLGVACLDQRLFHHVLNVFNAGGRVRAVAFFQQIDDKIGDFLGDLPVFAADGARRREDGVGDFALVERHDDVVPLHDAVDARH